MGKLAVNTESLIFFILSFFGVFVGVALYNLITKKKLRCNLTNFQSILFGIGFVYICVILWLVVTFFIDYYKGTSLQGYNWRPGSNELFFKLFGHGVEEEDQFFLFTIDFNFICVAVGSLLGAAVMFVVNEVKAKIKNSEDSLFYGYKFPKKSLKQYFKDEYADFRSQVTMPEYIFWWCLRTGMTIFLIQALKENASTSILLFSANLAATFVITPVRVLCFAKLFFGKMNYRVQTFINIFVFFGNFLGHGFELNWEIDNYDKILHIVSGGVVVFIGYILIEGTRRGKDLPASVKVFGSAGFSCVVMVAWEIFEFFSDFYIDGSTNQNFHYEPEADMLFYKVFGTGVRAPGTEYVLDTNIDIFFAVIGCVFCSVALYAFLKIREKKKVEKKV